MEVHDLIQGSPEWHAHRATHWNASDAPAMMGCSPYKTRTQLLQECKTGVVPEPDARAEALFAAGHRAEALARPLAEQIIGESLYPIVGSVGKLSASFDGVTMLENTDFEHKMLNNEIRAALPKLRIGEAIPDASTLPLYYQAQMEQQHMVNRRAERTLFGATEWDGDRLVDARWCWYYPQPELAARIKAGWEQFDADLAGYQVETVSTPAVVAAAIESLPALLVNVEGRVVSSNLSVFKDAASAFLATIKTELSTDQDFADAERAVKFCKDGEDRLELVKQQALAQTASIDELFRVIDHISAEMRAKRLLVDKLVKTRKEQIRAEIVNEAVAALDGHIQALNKRLGANWVPRASAGFGEAIKGKKSVDSIRDAVSVVLANAKIDASALADRLETHRKLLVRDDRDWIALFPDFATVGAKPDEDFDAIAAQRIGLQIADEAEAAARVEARSAPAQPAPAEQINAGAQASAAPVIRRAPAPSGSDDDVPHFADASPEALLREWARFESALVSALERSTIPAAAAASLSRALDRIRTVFSVEVPV